MTQHCKPTMKAEAAAVGWDIISSDSPPMLLLELAFMAASVILRDETLLYETLKADPGTR